MKLEYGPVKDQDLERIYLLNIDQLDLIEGLDDKDYNLYIDRLIYLISDNISQYRRIYQAGSLVGYFFLEEAEEIMLQDIFILEAYQGQGLGQEFMDQLKLKNKTIRLNVLRNNRGGLRFYRRNGFYIVDEREDYFTMEYRARA